MDTIADLLTEKLIQRKIIDCKKREIYYTGIKLICADIINFSLIMVIGLITKSFVYSLIYIVEMVLVRRFSGGFHAKTYGVCRILTVGTYVMIFIVSRCIDEYYSIYSMVFGVLAIVSMIIFAPIRHPNKELNETERKANKLFSVLTTSGFVVLAIILSICSRKSGLIISLILFAITILMYVGLFVNRKGGKADG